ncbi:tetraacyldisaccharide 4'-kinase [Lignipirellula cremea]|uniref:Tetraacyldisaccharide 4'-kinase n=1 Tax=Lignipirellula cremea TaxID=2528010 RepID=A0A518DWG7_9BACT|nr:tetraacyldisaccharide 4'-kinase [Lignipirellula cremea]QDU96181.1 Tetraacyldisaccharide 4'-kinase [Lignipirellula cremea]
MLTPEEHREIVSGRRRGFGGVAWRFLLGAAACPYGWAVALRNRRYDHSSQAVTRVATPVISVGNITAGGTGKTPLVEWIARRLRQQEVRVTIVSRGYGAEKGGVNDEAKELEQRLPDVPHLQDPDRVAAAELAVEEFSAQLILLDDGFQHRRIDRDLDIVLLDALQPFGLGKLLPRGYLREPLTGLSRADAIVLTRADMIDAPARAELRKTVQRYNRTAPWSEVIHAPQCLRNASGDEQPIAPGERPRIAAFCGIGNPAGFRHTLEACGYEIAAWREFPDHHSYTRTDIESLAGWAAELSDVAALLCTHKDLVKIEVDRLGALPLWALLIGMQFQAGEAELAALIDQQADAALANDQDDDWGSDAD